MRLVSRWGVILLSLLGLGLLGQGQSLRWLEHAFRHPAHPTEAYGVSWDGRVVVGRMPQRVNCPEPPCGYTGTAFRWEVVANRVPDLFHGCDHCNSFNTTARAVSSAGDVIVGGPPGFRWEVEVQDFTMWYESGVAYGVSGDGRVVVGQQPFRGQAFRHVWGQPIERLGTLGGAQSEAWDSSWDGSVVVGRAQDAQGNWRAFRWTAETGMQDLGVLFDTHWAGVAAAVSADGTIVVGWTHGFTTRAFRWQRAVGMQALRAFPDGGNTFAQDVSADGRIIVGWAQVGMEERAVRWRADGVIEDLNVVFASLLQPGEVLRRTNGVSADGRYLVGWGERGGVVAAFWLDTRLTGDVNGDECVDDGDLLRVLFAFGQVGSGLPEDVDEDGMVWDSDLVLVLQHFGRGCR